MELFTTIGKVERAEIQYEPNGRSRGTGVVQFDSPDNADTAIGIFQSCILHPAANLSTAKFTGYQYGGRPLGLTFVRYTNTAGDSMQAEPTGLGQDQIM